MAAIADTHQNPLAEPLRRQGVLILDGGLASQLEARGADLAHPLWSARLLLENPNLVRAAHLEYLFAGADIVTTASYQVSAAGLRASGMYGSAARNVSRNSVILAKQARDEFCERPVAEDRLRPLVAASVGPFGATLADGSEYSGDYDLDEGELVEFHRPRIEALIEAGPDLLAFETIPSEREAVALGRLLETFPGTYAWLSFSCRDAQIVSHGELFSDCISRLEEFPQIVATGVNCSKPAFIAPLLRNAGESSKALIAYPNAGESWDKKSRRWLEQGRQTLEPVEWVQSGAKIVGGCCRVGPEEIRMIRERVLPEARSPNVEKPNGG